jgi:hypothetical protein
MSGHHAPSQEQPILTGVNTLLQSFSHTYLNPETGLFPRLLKEMETDQGGFTTDFRGLKPQKIAALSAAIPALNLILNTVLTHDLSLQEICSPLIQLMQQLVILEESNRNMTRQYNQSSTIASWFPSAQADEGTFGRHIQEAKNFIDTALRSSLSPEDFTTIQDYLQKPEGDLDLNVLTLEENDDIEAGYAAGDEEDAARKPRQDVEMQEQDLKEDDSEEMALDPDVLAAIAAEAIATEQGCAQTDSAQSEQTAASEPATTISTQPKEESTLQDLDRMYADQISRFGKVISSGEISTTTAPAAVYKRPAPEAAVTMPPPPPGLNPNAAEFSFGDISNPSSAPSSSVQAPVEQRHVQSSHSYSNGRHRPYTNPPCGFHGRGVVANFPPPGAVAGFISTPLGPVPGIFIPQLTPGIQQRPRAPQHSLASQGGHTSTTPRAPQYPLAPPQGAYNTATTMRGAHNSWRGHGHGRDIRHPYSDESYPHQ